VYRLTAHIRPDHPHDVKWEDLQNPELYPVREITATGEAYTQLQAQRPEGWISLGTTKEIIDG
jgi:hypothetical protein